MKIHHCAMIALALCYASSLPAIVLTGTRMTQLKQYVQKHPNEVNNYKSLQAWLNWGITNAASWNTAKAQMLGQLKTYLMAVWNGREMTKFALVESIAAHGASKEDNLVLQFLDQSDMTAATNFFETKVIDQAAFVKVCQQALQFIQDILASTAPVN
jgi:hypothetical protein